MRIPHIKNNSHLTLLISTFSTSFASTQWLPTSLYTVYKRINIDIKQVTSFIKPFNKNPLDKRGELARQTKHKK